MPSATLCVPAFPHPGRRGTSVPRTGALVSAFLSPRECRPERSASPPSRTRTTRNVGAAASCTRSHGPRGNAVPDALRLPFGHARQGERRHPPDGETRVTSDWLPPPISTRNRPQRVGVRLSPRISVPLSKFGWRTTGQTGTPTIGTREPGADRALCAIPFIALHRSLETSSLDLTWGAGSGYLAKTPAKL